MWVWVSTFELVDEVAVVEGLVRETLLLGRVGAHRFGRRDCGELDGGERQIQSVRHTRGAEEEDAGERGGEEGAGRGEGDRRRRRRRGGRSGRSTTGGGDDHGN